MRSHIYWNDIRLDAEFELIADESEVCARVLSRHGRIRRDYALGLELILHRLGTAGAALTDVVVDTGATRRRNLSREVCRVLPRDHEFPIQLQGVADLGFLSRSFTSQFGKTGVGGGGAHTPLKAARFYFDIEMSDSDLLQFLAHGPVPRLDTTSWSVSADNSLKKHYVVPAGLAPEHAQHAIQTLRSWDGLARLVELGDQPSVRVLRSLLIRRGQTSFRNALLTRRSHQECAADPLRIPEVPAAAGAS